MRAFSLVDPRFILRCMKDQTTYTTMVLCRDTALLIAAAIQNAIYPEKHVELTQEMHEQLARLHIHLHEAIEKGEVPGRRH